MLEIKNLHASVGEKPILRGISLTVNAGEVHAVMGPNGSGKSTLAQVLAGHPAYEVTAGEVLYEGENLLELDPEVIFIILLPPLLYDAASKTSWHEFRASIRPISALAITLVFFYNGCGSRYIVLPHPRF